MMAAATTASTASYRAIANTRSERPWRAGFWRRAPVAPLGALLTAVLCGFAAAMVIKFSDGIPIENWKVNEYNVQPTVLLSVLATVANALFRYAFIGGASIAWWNQAQRGTTLAGLYYRWKPVQDTFSPFTCGKHVTNAAIASVFVLPLLVDGPFLQWASSVGIERRQDTTIMTVPISPDPFVNGSTGYYGNEDDDSK